MTDSNPRRARIYLVKRIVVDMEGPIEEVVCVDLENSVDLMQQKIDALNKQEENKKKELVDFLAGKVKEVVELISSDSVFLNNLNEVISFDEYETHLFLKDNLNLSTFNLPCLVNDYNLDFVIGVKFFTLLDCLQQECNVIRGLEKIKFFRSDMDLGLMKAFLNQAVGSYISRYMEENLKLIK